MANRSQDTHRINTPPETVYFVGDTPESDIRGTNQYNEKAKNTWYSILVRTGVFQGDAQPAYKPMATVETVLDAVKHGMKREFDKKMKEISGGLLSSLAKQKMSLDGEVDIKTPIHEISEPATPEITTPDL